MCGARPVNSGACLHGHHWPGRARRPAVARGGREALRRLLDALAHASCPNGAAHAERASGLAPAHRGSGSTSSPEGTAPKGATMNGLLAILLSNLLVASVIGIVAVLAGRLWRRPALAHGL